MPGIHLSIFLRTRENLCSVFYEADTKWAGASSAINPTWNNKPITIPVMVDLITEILDDNRQISYICWGSDGRSVGGTLENDVDLGDFRTTVSQEQSARKIKRLMII